MSLTDSLPSIADRPSLGAVRSRLEATGAPWWAWLGVVLAPFIGVLFLRAPLINQIGYPDPWFDDSYAWSLAHSLRLFTDPYYGVRFPPILLIAGATDLFGAVAGYLVLHYLILLATGWVLYRCVRQFASAQVAVAAVVLLMLDVYFLRLELWDYTSFVQIPAMLGAVALWPRGGGRWGLLAAGGAGALISIAAFSQPLSLLIVPPVLLVEVVAAARERDGELVGIVGRLVVAAIGGAIAFLVGWFIYWLAVGFSPHDMIAPTLDFIQHGDGSAFSRPISSWIFDEPKIYAPVVAVVGLILIARRRLLGTHAAARLGQFSIAFVVEVWLYRVLDHSSAFVESWWAYDVTAISIAFSAALILDELDRLPRRRTVAIVAAVAAVALADLVLRLLGVDAEIFYNHLRDHYWRELAIVVIGLAALLLWSWLRPLARSAAVALLLIVVTVFSLCPAVYLGVGRTGEFGNLPLDELRTFSIGPTLTRDTAAHDTPASRTLLWYLQQDPLLASSWATLANLGGTVDYYENATGLPLSTFELHQLSFPTTARVLVVGQVKGDLARARAALRHAGYHFAARSSGAWLGGRVQHQLLVLRPLAAGDTDQAIRVMVGALRRAWRRGDAADLCNWTFPSLVGPLTAAGHGSCAVGMRTVMRHNRAPVGAITSIRHLPDGDIETTLSGVSTPWLFSRAGGDWLLVAGTPWIG